MKKIICSIVGLVIVVGIGVCIWKVNNELPPIPVQEYGMNEPVLLQKGDTFLETYERMSGYEVTALSAEMSTYDELVKKHNYVEDPENPLFFNDYLPPENLYVVRVKVKNTNTTILDDLDEPYIDFIDYRLSGLNYDLYFSSEVYTICNPKTEGVQNFRLMPQVEMEFDLPFVASERVPIEELLNEKPLRLAVSKYPVTRNIMVRLEPTGQKEGT